MFSPMGLKGFVPGERALGMEMSNDTPSDNEAFCPPAALIPLHREPQPAAALPALCASALRRRVALPLSRPPAPAVGSFPPRLCRGPVLALRSESRGFGLK